MIRLIIDSTCDMPQTLIKKYDIAVLPLQVIIADKSYRDGCDIHIEQLYEAMRKGIVPKTSQIDIATAEALFRGVCEGGNDLIYLSFSGKMSGTYQAAQMVMRMVQTDYPERRMSVVDSQGGCFATGLLAMQTARWIASGKSFDQTLSLITEMRSQVQHLFTLDSLNWLSKGGRLLRPVGFVGDKLQIKPIMDVEEGAMHISRIVRGRKHTVNAIVQMLLERIRDFPEQLIGITHADDPEAAAQIEQAIRSELPKAKTIVLPIGCVLGSHLGIGGVGMFFLKKRVTGYDLLSETGI